jgi:hypothetical protein
LDLNHTCNTSIVRERSISIKRLRDSMPLLTEYIPHTGSGGVGRSDAVQLLQQVQSTTGVALTYSTSFRLVGKQSAFSPELMWQEIGEIEAYVAGLKEFDPAGVYEVCFVLDTLNRRRFESIVMITSRQIRLSRACRGVASSGLFVFLVAVSFCSHGLDGCHLYSPAGGVLLSRVEKDANDGTFPTAIMICPIENKVYWLRFYTYIALVMHTNIYINDADKGSKSALRELEIPSASCTRHVGGNVATRFPGPLGAELKPFVYLIAQASTFVDLASVYTGIRNSCKYSKVEDAILYLKKREEEFASVYFVEQGICRYGEMLSNGVEQWNSSVREERKLGFLSVLALFVRSDFCADGTVFFRYLLQFK